MSCIYLACGICPASAPEKQWLLEVECHKLEYGCGCGPALSLQPPRSPSSPSLLLGRSSSATSIAKELISFQFSMLTVQPEELLLLAKALESVPTALLSGLQDFQNRLHLECQQLAGPSTPSVSYSQLLAPQN